jgi:uncharacterized protein (DUF305 family)
MNQSHYGRLLLMTLLSFVAMYILMYAMVDRFANVYNSVNQFYMAGLMAASMVLIELAVMKGMYPDRRKNIAVAAVGVLALAGFWFMIREQTAVGDRQFIRSMIPHHSGAILMCNEASIADPELQKLCREIVIAQQREIDQMNAIRQRLSR